MCLSPRPGEEIWEFFRRLVPILKAHNRTYDVVYKGTIIEATPEDDHDTLYAKWRGRRK